MKNYDVKDSHAVNGVRKYGWIFIILAVIAAVIFVRRPGKPENFSITPDPAAALVSALEKNSPVFIEFYSTR